VEKPAVEAEPGVYQLPVVRRTSWPTFQCAKDVT
jgi:hypothetical protein